MFNLTTTIKAGSHKLPSEGSCTMEIAILAAGFDWTAVKTENDLPECMCRVIGAYVIRLNDAMPDAERQRLMAFVPRLTQTRGTKADDKARAEYLVMHAARPAAAAAMGTIGLTDHAAAIRAAETMPELRKAAMAAAAAAAAAAAWAGKPFDWTPYLDALDGALRIGPQAPELAVDNIERARRILETA